MGLTWNFETDGEDETCNYMTCCALRAAGKNPHSSSTRNRPNEEAPIDRTIQICRYFPTRQPLSFQGQSTTDFHTTAAAVTFDLEPNFCIQKCLDSHRHIRNRHLDRPKAKATDSHGVTGYLSHG